MLMACIAFLFSKSMMAAEETSARVEIPRSDLIVKDDLRPHSESTTLDMMVSSWTPSNLQMPSVVKNSPAFETDIPLIKLGIVTRPFSFLSSVGLSGIAYVGYMKLSRSAQTPGFQSLEQSVHLIPMQAGLQMAPTFLRWRGIRPGLQIYGMPTLTTTPDNSFSRGRTNLNWLYGSTVGLEVNPFGFFSADAANSNSVGLHLGMTLTSGEVQTSGALNVGFEGGLLVRL